MISRVEIGNVRRRTVEFLDRANIVLREDEKENIEVADFGLGQLDKIGLEIVVYVNTSRCCAKELVMFPGQICPQHRHPPYDQSPGKEETFRCRWGEIYLYVPGEAVKNPKGYVPLERKNYFTVWRQIVLNPGDQYTLQPDTWHWFQAGQQGAIVSEFSTRSRDELDIFIDPQIKRVE
ncbi:MAG: D-lyxose/D-mannose family sugar isomerase [Phycisphaerae bacterium]